MRQNGSKRTPRCDGGLSQKIEKGQKDFVPFQKLRRHWWLVGFRSIGRLLFTALVVLKQANIP